MAEVDSERARPRAHPSEQQFVGGVGIFFGLLGLLHALGSIDLARTMMTDGDWVFEIEKELHVDPWFAAWQIKVGYLAVAVAAFYIAAALLLIVRAPHGVTLFRAAAGTAIASAVVKAYVASWPGGYLVSFGRTVDIAGCVFSGIVNVWLLLLLFRAGRRDA
jgi:hypothetical protein